MSLLRTEDKCLVLFHEIFECLGGSEPRDLGCGNLYLGFCSRMHSCTGLALSNNKSPQAVQPHLTLFLETFFYGVYTWASLSFVTDNEVDTPHSYLFVFNSGIGHSLKHSRPERWPNNLGRELRLVSGGKNGFGFSIDLR